MAGVSPETIAELLPQIMGNLMGRKRVPPEVGQLTVRHFRALRVVTDQSGCTMGELARVLGVTLGAATGLVDRLIERGLVARVPDTSDRRKVRVQLTEHGRRAHLAAKRHARRQMAAALARLSPAQQEQVASALLLLRDALASLPGRP